MLCRSLCYGALLATLLLGACVGSDPSTPETGGAEGGAPEASEAQGSVDGALDAAIDGTLDSGDAGALFTRPDGGKWVFTTSTTTDGAFGSLGAADMKCNELATHLGGAWVAWLSSGTGATGVAKARLTSTGPFYLVTGELVAASSNDLVTTPYLAHAIDRDEHGLSLLSAASSSSTVWTGTNATGAASAVHCNGWTTTVSTGAFGTWSAKDTNWGSTPTALSCATPRHFYCFEL